MTCEACSEVEALYDECTILGASPSPETPCRCPDTCLPLPSYCSTECPTEACGSPTCSSGFCETDCSACSPIVGVSSSSCAPALEAQCQSQCGSCAGCTGGSECAACYSCTYPDLTSCSEACVPPSSPY